MKLKCNDSETVTFDLDCLGKSTVSATVGLLHGDVVGFKVATTENELALMSALSQLSVSIAVEAQLYKTGVITATRGPVRFPMVQDRRAWVSSPCPSSSKLTSSFLIVQGQMRGQQRVDQSFSPTARDRWDDSNVRNGA